MKKLISIAVLSIFSAGVLSAAGVSDADFAKKLSSIAPAAAATVQAGKAEPVLPAKAEKIVRTGRYVQVSGYVTLNGNGFVPANGGFTSVTLNGWATFRDSTGKVTSNNTYINPMVSMFINPNQYVFQTVWPNVYAQFYQNGKPVGSTSMSGSISVSGFPSGSFVYLNGSGYLNGSIYVQDAE